jgi:hypothetical protein
MKSDYTVEVYKIDKRYKNGRKLFGKFDLISFEKDNIPEYIEKTHKYNLNSKFVIEVHETWVTRKNHLDGKPFIERYDVPYFCSPSSETFWSS